MKEKKQEKVIFPDKIRKGTTEIDISRVSLLRTLKDSRKRRCCLKVFFFVRNAEGRGFSDNSFDAVVCFGVLHHLKIGNTYKEIAKNFSEILTCLPTGRPATDR